VALIAKVDLPLAPTPGGVARVHARPYNEGDVTHGKEIFVWTAQRTGGHRLAARGTVLEARIDSLPNASGTGSHKELVVDIQLVGGGPLRPLATDQIPSLREGPAASGDARLYTHALNKITSLESEVADLVRSHFEDE